MKLIRSVCPQGAQRSAQKDLAVEMVRGMAEPRAVVIRDKRQGPAVIIN